MACKYKYNDKWFTENELIYLIGEKKNLLDISNKQALERLDSLQEIFKQSPELQSIGTIFDYDSYLDTIFPDSKVKDIVYHKTESITEDKKLSFDKFKKGRTSFYFAETPEIKFGARTKGISFPFLLDIKNPRLSNEYNIDITEPYEKEDGVLITPFFKETGANWYVVFEPEQIHILGSKQDIEGFKQFVGRFTQEVVDSGIDTSKKINIYAGTGENADLSNFAIRPFIIGGDEFQSVEQYFQYQKWNYLKEDITEAQFKEDQKIADAIMNTSNGAALKSLGRKFKNLDSASWDRNASKEMKIALKASFEQNPQALQKLLATGNAELTHSQDKGKWGKEFPKLLMEVRQELNPNIVDSNKEITKEDLDKLPYCI